MEEKRYRKIYDDQLIVITGAAGFIGSGVVRYLNERGFTNLLLVDDIKKTEKWKNLQHKAFVDLISRHTLFSWLEGKEMDIEAFIHLGACSDTLEKDGDFLLENNYRFTVRLAEYALTHGKRFIYASSAATYGKGEVGFSDEHEHLEQLTPLNLYGYSKHLFDLWAKKEGVLDQIVGLKYFNVFGPNEEHKGKMASMVYKMLPVAKQKQPIRLFKSSDPLKFADGEQCRDFIYVKDAVKITCSFLENHFGGIYNVGRGEAISWNRLAKALFTALDLPCQIEYIDMPVELSSQYQNYTVADMGKYKKLQGVASPGEYTLEEGVNEYVRQYLLQGTRW